MIFLKNYKMNSSKSLYVAFKLSHFLSIKYISCIRHFAQYLALCTMRCTSRHSDPREVAPTRLQVVAPNGNSHKTKYNSKIHVQIIKLQNAILLNILFIKALHVHAYANELSHILLSMWINTLNT